MKRKHRIGACVCCAGNVAYSQSILPITAYCSICGAKAISFKTLTGKQVIYTITDMDIIKTISWMPKEGKKNESV